MSAHAVDSADRLGVTLLFSLILHGVVILGLTFRIEMPKPTLPSLDVVLVRTANSERPEKADFLAQADNSGGGTSEEASRPTQPFSSPLPKPDSGVAPKPMNPSAPEPDQASGPEVLTRAASDRATPSKPEVRQQVQRDVRRSPEEIRRRLEMARLAAEIQESRQDYAKRPRKKFISANTAKGRYARYLAQWSARIERVGNLNYPDVARRDGLHGELVLTVGLNRDGSVQSIDLIDSSGHKVLDDAAQRIVRLAAPFAPTPEDREVDILYITKTWQFLPGNVLKSR